jgi:hypothetical protein
MDKDLHLDFNHSILWKAFQGLEMSAVGAHKAANVAHLESEAWGREAK